MGGSIFQAVGVLKHPLDRPQDMQTFQVESQADQTPFASGGGQAPQRELAKAQHFFDQANHWLDRAFPQAVNGLADFGLKFVGHLDRRAGIVGRRTGLFSKIGAPVLMMGFPPGRDIRVNWATISTTNRAK